MTNEFNWNETQEDIVLSEQLSVAIYENPNGDTVIRQAAPYPNDQDSIIVICRNNLATFVAALQQLLKKQQEAGS